MAMGMRSQAFSSPLVPGFEVGLHGLVLISIHSFLLSPLALSPPAESVWVSWASLSTTPQMAQTPCSPVHVPYSALHCMRLPPLHAGGWSQGEEQDDVGPWLLQVERV